MRRIILLVLALLSRQCTGEEARVLSDTTALVDRLFTYQIASGDKDAKYISVSLTTS